MVITSSLLFATVVLFMTFKDMSSLYEKSHAFYYLLGRGAVIGTLVIHAALAYFHRLPSYYPAHIYAVAIFYSAHGQYFQPNYWLAFIELNALFVTLFPVPRRHLPFFYAVGFVIFVGVFFHRADFFLQNGAFTRPLVEDVLVGIFLTQAISLVLYDLLLRLREETLRLNQRFTDLGRNFSFVLHDLKGMISSHVVYATMLRSSGRLESMPKKEQEALNYLTEDIQSLQHFVAQINTLIRSELTDEVARTRVRQSFDLVKVLFRSKLKKVDLTLTGDIELNIRPYVLNRIFINALTNSIEEFNRNKVEHGMIRVVCSKNRLSIEDNSGTRLEKDLLDSLNRPFISLTSKPEGSGMGTFIIKQYVQLSGGNVRFFNGDAGVNVEIQFAKSSVVDPGAISGFAT
ncbi:MAG: ATP-binding protein [Oligoflexia bacterium]|nr:ATP-binding protein [Oligoflexia bacterium]